MPSSIYSNISSLPTLADAETPAINNHKILIKLEASLAKTRNSLEKALDLCLAVEAERTELARDPHFEKFVNRPLADNKAEYEEMKTFLLHTRRINHNKATTYHPQHLKGPSGIAMFVGEGLQSRIWQVVKVQRQKERRVRRMEKLYEKEKDLVAGILQVRGVTKKCEEERKGNVPVGRVLMKATGTKGT